MGLCHRKPSYANTRPTNTEAESETTPEGNNKFAFNMFKQLTAENPRENIFFSPYSISSAMSMLLLGSRGISEEEIKVGLGYRGLEGVHEDNQEIRESIQKLGQGVTLETANRLFLEKSFNLFEEFITECKKYYDSGATSLDYMGDSEGSRKFINDWVAKQTRDKIENLLPKGSITPLTKLVLANAVYFKGNWKDQFDPAGTRKRDFHVSNAKKVVVDMMAKKHKYRYAEDPSLKIQVLEIPYKGHTTSMVIVLPYKKFGLKAIEASFDANKLTEIEKSLRETEVELSLPKFKLEFGADLVQTFQHLGVKSIFGGKADFSGITGTKELFVSAIAHKAFMEVNEEGTEAAAVTEIVMQMMSLSPPEPRFICNHPFLFFIKHTQSNTILFAGRCINPKK